MKIICNQVYYVDPLPGKKALSIAITPTLTENSIEWNNTTRNVKHQIKSITTEPPIRSDEEGKELALRKITVITTDNKTLTLTFLDLNLYHDKVQKFVPGKKDFSSDEKLQEFYLKTNFDDYLAKD